MTMVFITRLIRVLAIIAIITGMLFKIQHWPGGDILFISGMTGLAGIYLADFIIDEIRRRRKA